MVSPIMAPVTEAVFAPGYIEAENQFTLQATADGYITDLLISEGDSIKDKQVLFILDKASAEIQEQVADSNFIIVRKQASENSSILKQLYEQKNLMEKKLEQNKMQFERMERLYATGSVAKTELENAKIAFENAESEIAVIQYTIAATSENLSQALVNAKGQQQTAKVNKGYYQIQSPGAYKVFKVFKRKGELVRKGESLAILGDIDRKKIILNVDESSIAKINIGQKALVELNTEKGETHHATVNSVYPSFDETTQSYKVEMRFDTAYIKAMNGTMLQANIIVAYKENVMLIPRTSLGPDNRIRVKKEKKIDTVSVQTGIISNEWAEIISGLKLTDKIVQQF